MRKHEVIHDRIKVSLVAAMNNLLVRSLGLFPLSIQWRGQYFRWWFLAISSMSSWRNKWLKQTNPQEELLFLIQKLSYSHSILVLFVSMCPKKDKLTLSHCRFFTLISNFGSGCGNFKARYLFVFCLWRSLRQNDLFFRQVPREMRVPASSRLTE